MHDEPGQNMQVNPDENIQDLIPQRPPFVMIGRLLDSDEQHTRTAFRVREDNIFVENGRFTEPGLLENIAQTAAARAGALACMENRPVQVGYIGAVRNLEINDLPKTGDELITEIKIEDQVFNVTIVSGKVWCDGIIVAQCEMKIFMSPAGSDKQD
jgi:3-hydroxymyristoyl/3-hydroxydecanoyl-(acyl carrier protein) dehydratase